MDGEAVVVVSTALPSSMPCTAASKATEAILYAFDLLELDGEDLRPLPLGARKAELSRLQARAHRHRLQRAH